MPLYIIIYPNVNQVPLHSFNFLTRGATTDLGYGAVAIQVGKLSGCSTQILCRTPASVILAARLSNWVSFLISRTTCMNEEIGENTGLKTGVFIRNAASSSTYDNFLNESSFLRTSVNLPCACDLIFLGYNTAVSKVRLC